MEYGHSSRRDNNNDGFHAHVKGNYAGGSGGQGDGNDDARQLRAIVERLEAELLAMRTGVAGGGVLSSGVGRWGGELVGDVAAGGGLGGPGATVPWMPGDTLGSDDCRIDCWDIIALF